MANRPQPNPTKHRVFLILLFTVVGFVALQIPVTQLAGSAAKFTTFDALAPVAGAFVGSLPGVVAVFLMQYANFLVHGAQVVDAGAIIRFFPMLFAVLYFARKHRFNLLVPALAMVVFLAHPIGRQVWYYTLFWTIPMVAYVFHDRFLLARALGATFTAHAVGGAMWIWTFALPAQVWIGLIPIVIVERLLFSFGIAATFVLVNNLLFILDRAGGFKFGLQIDQKYLVRALRHGPEAKVTSPR